MNAQMSEDGYDISTESHEVELAKDSESNVAQELEITTTKNTWIQTAVLILADDIGLGITTLPYAMKELGWGWGILFHFIIAGSTFYTGLLFADWNMHYDEMLRHVMPWFPSKVFLGIGYMFTMISYLMTTAFIIQRILFGIQVCFYQATLIAGTIMFGFSQFQTFHSTLPMMVIGILLVFVFVGIVFYKPDLSDESDKGLQGVLNIFLAHNMILYAFTGHLMFPEFKMDMINQRKWPNALSLAMGLQLIMYLFVACLGYYILGNAADGNLVHHLPKGKTLTIVACVAMLIHLIVPYIIRMQVITRYVYNYDTNWPCTLWLIISFGFICLHILIINLVPFLDIPLTLSPVVFSFPVAIIIPIAIHWVRNDLDTSAKVFTVLIVIYATIFAFGGFGASFVQLKTHYEFVDIFTCRHV